MIAPVPASKVNELAKAAVDPIVIAVTPAVFTPAPILIVLFAAFAPEPILIVCAVVLAPSAIFIVLPATPFPIAIVCATVPPMVTAPVEVPVLILVAKFELAFKLIAAPVEVIPALNVPRRFAPW